MRTRTKVLVAVPVVVLAVGVGGPFVYIHLVKGDAPDRLSLGVASTASASAAAPADGTPLDATGAWKIAADSVVGYRVKETLVGQSTEAVGRTSRITGGFTVADLTITAGQFTVDMASVKSDSNQRDNQFRNRIMDVATYPTATFVLTSPATIPAVPADRATVQVPVTGDLTLHGTTKPVTVTLTAQRAGQALKVLGTIPVSFPEYGVDNPSGGPATVGDDGTLEILLDLTK